MAANRIYFSNASLTDDRAIEAMMIAVNEKLGFEVCIADFDRQSNDEIGSMIVLCNGIDINELSILQRLEQLYHNNQAIILYEPTNSEVNHVFHRLKGKNYFTAETKGHRHSLFGIKCCKDGICRILESHEKNVQAIAESVVQFLDLETEEKVLKQRALESEAAKALEYSNTNLYEAAMQHVITHKFELAGKPCSCSYYVVSAHKYMGEDADGGEDWFFIKQDAMVSGGNGYTYKWAGARVDANGESWYVGDGDVCLNYVNYCMMQNDIKQTNKDETLEADLIYAEPEAINNETTHSVTEGVEIGGMIGFEAGSDGGAVAKGNGSFSAGANFSNTYSFTVKDVTCVGTSLSAGIASASWKYSFQRARQNRSLGKWQHLYEPAALSRSTFSPKNSWVWKFPTSKRDEYKSFESLFRISTMNTISRYSGSQSPKHIVNTFAKGNVDVEYEEQSFEVTLASPPLLGVNKSNFLLSKDAQSVPLELVAQGPWTIQVQSNQNWLRVNRVTGVGHATVNLSVDLLTEGNERSTSLTLIKSAGRNSLEEQITIEVMQSAGSVPE